MKILALHNHYKWRGGEDDSFEAEVVMLRAHGHEVDVIVDDNSRIDRLGHVRTAVRTLWSLESYRRVRAALRLGRHDFLYAQNTFPLLSPSVYYAAKAEGVPVIQTLRNFRLLCLNGLLFRDGRVCEECVGKRVPWPGVLHGCYRDSRVASAVVASMLVGHRAAGTYSRKVDSYVALTEFSRDKFIEGGLPAERIEVKPNFVIDSSQRSPRGRQYALYVGRLADEKGIDILLDAWSRAGVKRELIVAGDGPLADTVRDAETRIKSIRYVGRKRGAELRDLLEGALVVVFPSKVYENFPRIIVDAFAASIPVIASRHGAMSRIVEHHRTGMLFEPGSVDELVKSIEWAFANEPAMIEMGRAAYAEYREHYTADANHEIFERIGHFVMARAKS